MKLRDNLKCRLPREETPARIEKAHKMAKGSVSLFKAMKEAIGDDQAVWDLGIMMLFMAAGCRGVTIHAALRPAMKEAGISPVYGTKPHISCQRRQVETALERGVSAGILVFEDRHPRLRVEWGELFTGKTVITPEEIRLGIISIVLDSEVLQGKVHRNPGVWPPTYRSAGCVLPKNDNAHPAPPRSQQARHNGSTSTRYLASLSQGAPSSDPS